MKLQTVKELLNDRQAKYLQKITDLVLAGEHYGLDLIQANNGVIEAAEIRRKIVFLAKLKYNVTNVFLGKYLNMDNSHIGYYMRTAIYKYQINKNYQYMIDKLLKTLN